MFVWSFTGKFAKVDRVYISYPEKGGTKLQLSGNVTWSDTKLILFFFDKKHTTLNID